MQNEMKFVSCLLFIDFRVFWTRGVMHVGFIRWIFSRAKATCFAI